RAAAMKPAQRAFTLVELAVALLVIALLLSGLAVPLAAQVQLRRQEETLRLLEEARDALMGFAAANGRLPCPATEASAGQESFTPAGNAANGDCAAFYSGYLPGATLGMAPLDANGFVRDPWLTPRSRLRYAVFGGGASINGVANPLTRANGLQAATLPALGNASHFLIICSGGTQATASGCGPATSQLTRRAAFVVFSLGPNGVNEPAPGSDEARNLDGDAVFVHREPSAAAGREFDDQLLWVPIHLVVNRLMAAGRLP
ncbi:MAG TPA: prepilin-type N-terminal cleavage/methylation domain-containing protein, partial [Usitatibacter sp.]|nr:prepilin-type N-terminal cleavage/methylation domain-containing protein [Usitatibacter sp.]